MKADHIVRLTIASIILLSLYACNSSVTSPAITSSDIKPTATEVFRQNLSPTATEIQLSFNPNVKNDGNCEPPNASLSKTEAENLSEDEIAYKLFDIWLSDYKKPGAPLYCRIADYTIDKVYYDERTPYLPLEPKGDIMRVVIFSVKLIQIPNVWMSFSGEIDQDNWLHTAHAIAIFKTDTGYIMKFANP
jgi:hypothetical protein